METRGAFPPIQPAGRSTYGAFLQMPQVVYTDASVSPSANAHCPQQPPLIAQPAGGWFVLNQANRPQTNSAGAALLVLVSGGMNIAWSCGFDNVQGFTTGTHIMICWYIAAIIGALVSVLITNYCYTKLIYLFSSFLVLVGGIFFVALPDEHGAIAAARYLNGFAVGLVFVAMIVLISEEVTKSSRGWAAAILVSGSITLGIFLQIVFAALYSYSNPTVSSSFGTTQLHGIVVVIYAVLTFIMSYFFVIESPVQHLIQHNQQEAVDCMRLLQRPFLITQETYERLEEHKRYIDANTPDGDKGVPALVKLCIIRGLVALSFSPVVAGGLLLATTSYTEDFVTWPWILFGLFLWLGSYVAAFLMDSVGRKTLLLIGALVCGVLAIAIGAIFNDLINIFYSSKMGSVLYMLFAVELFASLFNSSSAAYLTEAFPLRRKPYYIALSFIVEMLVLLIIGVCPPDHGTLGAYFITFGVFYLALFVLGLFCLPETKRNSLQEAQSKF